MGSQRHSGLGSDPEVSTRICKELKNAVFCLQKPPIFSNLTKKERNKERRRRRRFMIYYTMYDVANNKAVC
jgi:hypothetical protein